MSLLFVLRATSVLVVVVCAFMLIPVGVAAFSGEAHLIPAFLVPMGASAILFLVFRVASGSGSTTTLSVRGSYVFVVLGWLLSTAAGTAPMVISGAISRVPDAFFEVMSGFTTTGASILTDIESLPQSILLWRSLTHWLGGMGIVVLTVALFPLLGIGGTRLLGAEAPGPTVDKVTPRVTDTAKILWGIYVMLTVAEIALLAAGGMTLLEAATHTFGTLATGGFSMRNHSIGHYDSAYIDAVVTVFMLLAGANFGLYWRLTRGQASALLKDTELKVYLGIAAGATAVVAADLVLNAGIGLARGIRYASFQAVSILTTTGYVTADYTTWPALSQVVLFCLMFVGGCAGSTGGGMKVVRLTMLFRQAMAEMRYLVWPRGVFSVRINTRPVRKNAVYGVYSFVFLYLATLLATTLLVASAGYDILSALSTSLATLGNIGPGFGLAGPAANYAHYPDYVKVALSFIMMTGRLELYTVLLLLTPTFWKR